jgi:hypothetical protein
LLPTHFRTYAEPLQKNICNSYQKNNLNHLVANFLSELLLSIAKKLRRGAYRAMLGKEFPRGGEIWPKGAGYLIKTLLDQAANVWIGNAAG